MEHVNDAFMKDARLRREEADMDLLDFAEKHLFRSDHDDESLKASNSSQNPKFPIARMLNSSKRIKTSNPQLFELRFTQTASSTTKHNALDERNEIGGTRFTDEQLRTEDEHASLIVDEAELSILESLSQSVDLVDFGNDEKHHELSTSKPDEELTQSLHDEEGEQSAEAKKRRILPSWFMNEEKQKQVEQEKLTKLRNSKDELKELGSRYSDEHPQFLAEKEHIELKTPPKTGRIICFDLETTGFATTDQIVEIGAVEIIDGERTGILFQSYCKPTVPIHSLAQEAHGLSAEFLASHPTLDKVLPTFLKFVGKDSTLVAHNISFDMRMLYQELDRLNLFLHPDQRIFCTQKYFRLMVPGIAYSLSSAASHFGVDKTFHRKTHGALLDSEILTQVYLKLSTLSTQ